MLDDSINGHRGKKMEGDSSHFDHVSGRYVMGVQVLTLGLATEEGFLLLDLKNLYWSKQSPRVGSLVQGRS